MVTTPQEARTRLTTRATKHDLTRPHPRRYDTAHRRIQHHLEQLGRHLHYSLFGNSGALRPPRKRSSISDPIHTFLFLAIPSSTSATLPAWTSMPFPLAPSPNPINQTTAAATSTGLLIGTPRPRIRFAQSESDSPGSRPETSSVRVMPGATTEIEMLRVAVSFLRARMSPTIPV